jgi:hypothetical protein
MHNFDMFGRYFASHWQSFWLVVIQNAGLPPSPPIYLATSNTMHGALLRNILTTSNGVGRKDRKAACL